MNESRSDQLLQMRRRAFLGSAGVGFGSVALKSLMAQENPKPLGTLSQFHLPPKVKNVIFLFMAGGPSQLELFADKPVLNEFHGKLPLRVLLKDDVLRSCPPMRNSWGPIASSLVTANAGWS